MTNISGWEKNKMTSPPNAQFANKDMDEIYLLF